MARRCLQHSQHHTQARLAEDRQQQQQQQQLTQGVGTQFEDTNIDSNDMSLALEVLPDDSRASSPLLRAVLGRTIATDNARKSLLKSEVIEEDQAAVAFSFSFTSFHLPPELQSVVYRAILHTAYLILQVIPSDADITRAGTRFSPVVHVSA
ncbi:hypothetical protein F4776DRAFT_662275 [Hypoxylon sp. NC0597]|nr:hypothetical protein F4776DRAFT_662275 [Hypoxylon sp. NC0597]